MFCYDLNVVFTAVAENAERLFFAFAGDPELKNVEKFVKIDWLTK
jgi:hypothetical protein